MKIKDCTYGKIVTDGARIGIIVGISNNCPHADEKTRGELDRAVSEVKWSSGLVSTIHPGNIKDV